MFHKTEMVSIFYILECMLFMGPLSLCFVVVPSAKRHTMRSLGLTMKAPFSPSTIPNWKGFCSAAVAASVLFCGGNNAVADDSREVNLI